MGISRWSSRGNTIYKGLYTLPMQYYDYYSVVLILDFEMPACSYHARRAVQAAWYVQRALA